jgi:hypothetical protein
MQHIKGTVIFHEYHLTNQIYDSYWKHSNYYGKNINY